MSKVIKTELQWRQQMDDETYHITREKGTERAFSGKYWKLTDQGTYCCSGCGEKLFSSDTKFDAGCGWPSFYQPIAEGNIEEIPDHSHGMVRTEVVCKTCDSHLGHIFPDGPVETGLRYCINSASMNFEKKD